ncbi:MAG: GNAT family N-acetyltransferase, partial [Chloroflexota bacterium]|nr:GNAT family N-acetyltransferase [Chloroflexota bacterium]
RWARGRWLSTGGGGYDAYRVVPRTWSLVWLAGAHRDVPAETAPEWRTAWSAEATRYGQAPMPTTFDDPPNAGLATDDLQLAAEAESTAGAALVYATVVPDLLREADARGWWQPLADAVPPGTAIETEGADGEPMILRLTPELLDRVTVAPRVVAPMDPGAAHALLAAGLRESTVMAAVAGSTIVGLALAADRDGVSELLTLCVAPGHRRRGLGTALLRSLVDAVSGSMSAVITLAERDPVEPLDGAVQATIATRMLESAGFVVRPAEGPLLRLDPAAVSAERR